MPIALIDVYVNVNYLKGDWRSMARFKKNLIQEGRV